VSHDEDGSAGGAHLAGKEDAVGYERGVNPHDVEETLADPEELRPATLEADAAGAGVARKDRVQESVVLTGRCDPVVEVCVTLLFGFEADAGAVGTAEIDCGVDELLQDRIGVLDEGVAEGERWERARSRFFAALRMTARKATARARAKAKARTKANTEILRCALDDGGKGLDDGGKGLDDGGKELDDGGREGWGGSLAALGAGDGGFGFLVAFAGSLGGSLVPVLLALGQG
jgi:hypothetical protein